MSQVVNKSAISVLDEFCKRKLQSPPVYTFISDESGPFFEYTVKSFNETKTGKAKSKKKAKNAAALSLINHLTNMESFKFDLVFLNVCPDLESETKVSSSTTTGNKSEAQAKPAPEINYVGKLLEYCTKHKLPPASFEMIENTTTSRSPSEFCMKCTVSKVEKLGTGSNKKQAKRMAAMAALLELDQSTPTDDEPPLKRLKTSDKSEDADTSSAKCETMVVKTEYEETPKDSIFPSNHSDYNDDDVNDDDEGDGYSVDDCEEIIDSAEVFSVESNRDSDQTFEDY